MPMPGVHQSLKTDLKKLTAFSGGLAFRYPQVAISAIYTEDRISFQIVSGVLFSPFALASRTPVLDYAQTNLRIGWMLNNPKQSESILRGNVEAIVELSNSIIYKGFGNYMVGVTGLIRYNFVQPDSQLIPYIQGGVGVVYTDAYKDYSQNAIGQAIEFTPQVSLGLHYLIDKKWSIDTEAMFHHISNAGQDERNRGINAFGGFIGLTYFFDRLWK
jgi:lipid A 3-O-deacylase